jgi:hypothetical protein
MLSRSRLTTVKAPTVWKRSTMIKSGFPVASSVGGPPCSIFMGLSPSSVRGMNKPSEVGSEGGAEFSRVGVLRGSPWASKNEVRVSSFSLWMLNDFF